MITGVISSFLCCATIISSVVAKETTPGGSKICNDVNYIKNRYDAMFPDAVVGYAAGPYQVNDGIAQLYAPIFSLPPNKRNKRRAWPSICPLKKCPNDELLSEIYQLYGGIPLAKNKLKNVAKLLNISYNKSSCDLFCEEITLSLRRHSDTLLIVTTLNHFSMTSKLLESLNRVKDDFDLLFIDDSSSDGTAEYLIKKGYAVIHHETPKGLTYSWNIGYRLSRILGYKYLVLSNNDVILPNGAIGAMRDVLINDVSVVVPLSTDKGAGHNPSQSFRLAYKLPKENEPYIENPYNVQKIQDALLDKRIFNDTFQKSMPSMWNNKWKFNGFLFSMNLKILKLCAHDQYLLFDPSLVVVGQEDSLVKCLRAINSPPLIAMQAFVYHFKSATISVANYTSGSVVETRNNLSLYHGKKRELRDRTITERMSLLAKSTFDSVSNFDVYPPPGSSTKRSVLCIATSNSKTNSGAGDLMTARELASSFRKNTKIDIVLRDQGPDWYNIGNCDVLLTLLPSFDISKIVKAKQTLLKIVWMRNWFHLYYQHTSFGGYDLVLASSDVATKYFRSSNGFNVRCHRRCPGVINSFMSRRAVVQVESMMLATNPSRFFKFDNANRRIDYLFSGNYWNCHREIMDLDPDIISEHVGHIYGRGWDHSPVNSSWRGIIRGRVLYEELPKIYHNASILIDDANHVTKPWGSVNSRVFDGLAGGALVITNGDIGSNCSFAGDIPTYSSINELEEKIRYFLRHEDVRASVVAELQKTVLKNHTYDSRAEQLVSLILRFGPIPENINLDHEGLKLTSKTMCIGIRTYEAQLNILESTIGNFLAQYKYSKYAQTIGFRIYLVDTDLSSPHFLEKLKEIIDRFNADMNAPIVSLVSARNAPERHHKNVLYGYDDTDMLLDFMTNEGTCDWIMLTNGDNMYNKVLVA